MRYYIMTEENFKKLQIRIAALEKSQLEEWGAIKKEQIEITQKMLQMRITMDNLLKEAKMLMGTMDEIASGTVGEIDLPSLEKPNLKTVVDAIMKVSNQLTSMNLRMTQLETLIASEAKESPTS
ncbi:MAG: hypothetical protein BCS36_04965 [Desulfovibrio sp. MES5]|nr:MAG: hypothetical protein BCS36_04965 [Desulfovibrio sp. MES5]